ncbi:MAG: TetM/TetW/TetO/TetS family tetracycline resistance ribosomal protection protein, partial [Lachnospiraceae bacterium]|nr:TetM/TetW/TetO/TetS family tetracycline resistance ribosomal protection protein [Lachnospiraceae bacterium]
MGILAHVDAGKTTLAESIMYLSGALRKLGRVDHGNAFLDTHELERARGITIFSKQAEVMLKTLAGDMQVTLLDTPGHVDFSAETERTLQVLDAAILVISGADSVQGHVQTLWKLLKRYGIPVFLFINKMDQAGTDKAALLQEIKEKLDENCLDFTEVNEELMDSLSMCSEELMNAYLETGELDPSLIGEAVFARKVFPCFFGSALKIWGVEEFLNGLVTYAKKKDYPETFGARVYKITRDGSGNRLTHMKITGGRLKVKSVIGEDKIDQIRVYSGTQFKLEEEVEAGSVCAVTGLADTFCGQGLGWEKEGAAPVLVPVLNYQIILPEGCDVHKMLKNMYQLEEEIPELHILWQEQKGEIHAQVMGEVQVEILRSLIEDRFGVQVDFGEGSIVYKETILNTVEGIGHYEPLRHYAEVHLLLEPLEEGSGVVFETDCSEDELDKNWQRLVMTHLEEKKHVGVLTGSEITDMKITLIAGRAHLKHTEGGDFRQSTYRAVRHGLKQAQSRLLEPYYEYSLEIPTESLGRAMTDIQRMHGEFGDPFTLGDMTILSGSCPVVTMNGYQSEVNSYSRGRGKLTCRFKCYAPCHNEEEVIAAYGYDSERDLENPTGSVFCAHGAGFVVPWEQVEDYAHIESGWKEKQRRSCGRGEEDDMSGMNADSRRGMYPQGSSGGDRFISQEEIEDIFERTYGTRAKDKNPWNRPAPRRVS